MCAALYYWFLFILLIQALPKTESGSKSGGSIVFPSLDFFSSFFQVYTTYFFSVLDCLICFRVSRFFPHFFLGFS